MALREQIDRSYQDAIQGMDIPWMLQQWNQRTPDKVAMVWCPFTGDEKTFTYRQLFDRARRLASGLQNKGVKKGDFVLIHMDPSRGSPRDLT